MPVPNLRGFSFCVQRERRHGKAETREHPDTPKQPSVEEATVTLPGTVGGWGGNEDVEETRAARLGGWIAWEAEERVA